MVITFLTGQGTFFYCMSLSLPGGWERSLESEMGAYFVAWTHPSCKAAKPQPGTKRVVLWHLSVVQNTFPHLCSYQQTTRPSALIFSSSSEKSGANLHFQPLLLQYFMA